MEFAIQSVSSKEHLQNAQQRVEGLREEAPDKMIVYYSLPTISSIIILCLIC